MSEVRLVVRDGLQDLSGNRHGGFVEAIVAALSAEPETIAELELAIERFETPRDGGNFFAGFSRGINDEPWDAGLVVIDLAARVIVSENSYFSPSRDGYRSYHDGHALTDLGVRYHLPDDWHFEHHADGWRSICERRRQARLASPPLDIREVLYGDALVEFIACECFAARDRLAQLPDDDEHADRRADEVRNIHARWLTTPRDDLRGQAPRNALLAKRNFLMWDLQDRQEQWSRQQRPPRALAEDSLAYRYAGCGTHELVLYYELVRHLVWECSDAVSTWARSAAATSATVSDFLTDEIPRLRQARDVWLDSPDEECRGRTPRSVIERERRRLPEAMSGHEAIIDCDCPLCQIQADLPGPVFWHLDGCNMDDDFAFSMHATLAEWEAEQQEWAAFNRRFEAEQQERERLGVSYQDKSQLLRGSNRTREEQSVAVRLFCIGATLAETIAALKLSCGLGGLSPADLAIIDNLNRRFGNLREVAQVEDVAQVAALIEPVLATFQTAVADAASQHPALQAQAERLGALLDRFLAPPPEPEEMGRAWDDDEMPF